MIVPLETVATNHKTLMPQLLYSCPSKTSKLSKSTQFGIEDFVLYHGEQIRHSWRWGIWHAHLNPYNQCFISIRLIPSVVVDICKWRIVQHHALVVLTRLGCKFGLILNLVTIFSNDDFYYTSRAKRTHFWIHLIYEFNVHFVQLISELWNMWIWVLEN